MSRAHRPLGFMAMIALLGAVAQAQELEPGVQTSTAAAPVSATPAAGATDSGQSGKPAVHGSDKPQPATGAASKGDKSVDRLELGTTEISGNRELPKVMYVVPWRKADLGDFAGRPPNSLLEEALTPVDRDVFRRQNNYYDQLSSGAASAKSQPGAAATNPIAPRPKDEK